MATNANHPAPALVRRLGPRNEPPNAGAPPDPTAVGEPQSPIWRNWITVSGQASEGVALLTDLNQGVGKLLEPLNALSGRAQFSVTTTQSAQDAAATLRAIDGLHDVRDAVKGLVEGIDQLLQPLQEVAKVVRSIDDVAEAIAKCCGEEGGCAPVSELSNLAFSMLSRLCTLRSHLMDRHDVDLGSVLDKLTDHDEKLIAQIAGLLQTPGLERAASLFREVVDIEPFSSWKQAGVDPRDARVYNELNARTAKLLAVECEVAHRVRGEAGDWPPPPPAEAIKPRAGAKR